MKTLKLPAFTFKLQLTVLIFLTAVNASIVKAAQPDAYSPDQRDEYEQLRDLALRIIHTYPPSEYYYLGVGQSPAPLVAFFQGLGLESSTLPISKTEVHEKTILAEEQSSPSQAKQSTKDRLFEHFSHYLPNSETIRSKRFLAIDLTGIYGGNGIASAKRLLLRYSGERNYPAIVESLALTVSHVSPEHDKFIDHKISLSDYPILKNAMVANEYKYLSEFGKFSLIPFTPGFSESQVPLAVRANYLKLKELLKIRIQADPILAEFSCQERLVAKPPPY